MTTASESCDTTSQMSLFGETCEPLPERTFFPTPTQSDGTRDGKAYRKDTNMFEGGSHSVQLSHLAAHGLLHTPTGTANQLSPSMAVRDAGSWGLSPQAIPASHSHSPGSDWARRMTATYGRKLSAYWLSCDPPDSWARTLLAISTWGSTTCYLTWKKSVTPAGRLLFRLVPSTPRTAGIGSGLWPTPDVPNGGRGIPKDAVRQGNTIYTADGRKVQEGLANAVKLRPTPQAHDVTTRGNTMADHHHYPHDLANAVIWEQPPAGMKLNSAWVSRLMGYPDDWLTLDGEATP
jgi:hypothetical protein